MKAIRKFEKQLTTEPVQLAGSIILVPTNPDTLTRMLYQQYQLLMAQDDDQFRLQLLIERTQIGDFLPRDMYIPSDIVESLRQRRLTEQLYQQHFFPYRKGKKGKRGQTQAIVPYRVSITLAKRLESHGISPENAIELSRNHRTSPGHILKWVQDHRLSEDEIEYLLQVRSDFDIPNEVGFAELHKLWIACGNERSSLPGEYAEGGGAGQGIFEQILEFVSEALGISKWSLWRLNARLDQFYDGDAPRLLHDLIELGWEVVLSNSTDYLELAGRNLDAMGITGGEYWEE